MAIRYISTRGDAPTLDFEGVLLTGLASDGGLYVPTELPVFDASELRAMRDMSYPDLAYTIVAPFVGESIGESDLREIISATYAEFRHPAVAPMVQLDHNQWVLGCFRGTLAFRFRASAAWARGFVGRRGERVVIMGATSGDTGVLPSRDVSAVRTSISSFCIRISACQKFNVDK